MQNSSRLAALLAISAAALLALAGSASAATIAPTITADEWDNSGTATDTGCSLREAVQSANVDGVAQFEPDCTAGTGDDAIQLQGSTYTLTTPHGGMQTAIATGDLEVTDGGNTLTVVGQGRDLTQIDGGDFDRIFDISSTSGAVTLDGLTVRNGSVTTTNGGGILSGANLTLQGVLVEGNTTVTAGNGGGIQLNATAGNPRSLILTDSSVNANIAAGAGGGVNLTSEASLTATGDSHIDGNDAGSQGGGINSSSAAASDITLTGPGVTVSDNDALALGGGIASTTGDAGSDVIMTGAVMNGNEVDPLVTDAVGGAIRYTGNGQVQIIDSRIQNNDLQGQTVGGAAASVGAGTGSLVIERSLITGNTTTVADNALDGQTHEGGAVRLLSGTGTINESRIGLNSLTVNDPQDHGAGAGISKTSELTISSSTVDGNTIDATLSANGGGLAAPAPTGPTRVINSTFSGNDIGTSTNQSLGGGIWTVAGAQPVVIRQSTFTQNQSQTGESLGFNGNNYTVFGSVFAEDGTTACIPNTLVNVNGFNVDAGTSCVGVADDTDIESTLAQLGPLTENGGPHYGLAGPSLTHELLGPGAAIDLVPPGDCDDLAGSPLLVDQRGAPRPSDAGCEPGAYEIVRCAGVSAFVGSENADTIAASSFPGRESFHALGGGDALNGDADANRLCGGNGGDDITGGGGADAIEGGEGDDDIFARDGVADAITCGTGTDDVQTDEQGVDTIAADCENVDFVPAPPPPPPPPPPGGGVVLGPNLVESPDCEPLRQKVRRLTKKIKKADDRKQKSKLKKKRSKARRQLRELGCAT